MPPRREAERIRTRVLSLRARRRSYAEIARSVGITRRHAVRIVAAARLEYAARFGGFDE